MSKASVKKVKEKKARWGSSFLFCCRSSWIIILLFPGVLGSRLAVEEASVPSGDLEWECAVGDVTPREAMVLLKTNEPRLVKVQYTHDPFRTTFQETATVSTLPERNVTAHIHLTDLTAHTQYWYRSLIPGKPPGRLCRFRTAPSEKDAAEVTFVLGSDLRQSFQPFLILEAMRKEHPDFWLLLGDSIYADKGTSAQTLADYWEKYTENRDEHIKRLLADTSVYVMWDDHEVDNDFNSTHPLLPIGRQAFFDSWPIRRHTQEPTRLYRAFRWGKAVEFLILDTRQYRNPAAHTMLGKAQKQWLFNRLSASPARFKFIISSVPFSDPRQDKWGGYSEERDEILAFIAEQKLTGLVFLAGDVHHAAVSRLPGHDNLREFIFGPLAAPMNHRVSDQESRFDFFYDASRNFGKITVKPDDAGPLVRIEWLDENNRLIHRVIFSGDSSLLHVQ